MSELQPIGNSPSVTYEAPTVSEEPLDPGGSYVSPASSGGVAPLGSGGAGTLGNSIIE
jgi:hypothetical protein